MDTDVESKLKTKEGTAPTLIILRGDDGLNGAYIIGDGVNIRCYGDCVMVYVLQLVAVYYIFDVDYPRAHAMFLGFLQQFVVNELFVRESSKKFKFFCKKVRPVFDKIKAQERHVNNS